MSRPPSKKVDIIEARETTASQTETKFKQSGFTLSISSPVLSAIQQAQGMAQAASQTSDGRMKALAAASTAFNLYNNAGAIAESVTNPTTSNPAAAARITLSFGTSKSQSLQKSQSDTARGSTLAAGNNINITATGAGQDSNILVQGSDVKSGGNTTLAADNQVNLKAAQNTSSQTSTNSNSSSSVSVSYGAGGWGFGASASKGKGSSDGADTTLTNTNITAGNTASINSGGDTNVKGAVVSANQIKATVGGNLNIESLQDKSTYTSQQSSMSASVSVGGGGNGASFSASKSNIDSNFQSVGQQSGLKAGDGGFQVSVNNNTDLKGSVIASTQSAIDNNKNTFTTGNQLTITDLQNQASFKGTAAGFSIDAGQQNGKLGMGGVGVGIGSASGSAASTSSAGISGIAGNTAVRTGDAETGLQRIFDANKVQREIDAQVQITQAFGKQASQAIGTYAKEQLMQAEAKQVEGLVKQQQANKARADGRTDDATALQSQADAALQQAGSLREQWGETGTSRVALHTLAGLLGGGAGGAAGAAASTLATPAINNAVQALDLPDALRQTLVGGAAAVLGGVVGGTAGAAGALNEATNNYLTSTQELQRDKEIAACKSLACTMGTKLKYEFISSKQDVGLLTGVAFGAIYQTADMAASIVSMVKNFPETMTALGAIVTDPEFRAKVGSQVADDYKQRIDMQTRAYNDGGWDGSITAGVEAGRLAVDIVSLGTAAMGAGKVIAKTAGAGGTAIADAATTMTTNAAKAFASLDDVSQTKWLSQTATWRAATTELAAMELQAGGKSHPLLRHGDQVELAQLRVRALDGLTPDGVQKLPVDASRWVNNQDMLAAVKQAQAEFTKTGQTEYVADMGRIVGDGYLKNSSTYIKTTRFQVVLDNKGMPITAFPVLK